jgi:class 3 adenylate cyclase
MLLGGHDPEHAQKMLRFAIQMADVASRLHTPLGDPVELRIGIHSGPAMSGVVRGGGGALHTCPVLNAACHQIPLLEPDPEAC